MAKIIINPFTGTKHLPGSGFCCLVTLCGEIDSFEQERNHIVLSEEGIIAEGLPNCPGCIDVAREVFENITKKELLKAKRGLK